MRVSANQADRGGRLINGFDYDKQSWVVNGRYIRCGHPIGLPCGCYGTLHSGEETVMPVSAAADAAFHIVGHIVSYDTNLSFEAGEYLLRLMVKLNDLAMVTGG